MEILKTVLLAGVLVPGSAVAERIPLLRDLVVIAGFQKQDIERIGEGVLARELEVTEPSRRAAFAGIVRIKGDGSGLADTVETLDLATVPGAVNAFGRFSNPPKPDDVAGLRFSDDDFEVLADCVVERCKFKLSRKGIEDLGKIDWNASDADESFTELFRKEVLAYVQSYRLEGSDALLVYADKSSPISIANTVDSLIKQFPGFEHHAPALASYLTRYPDNRSPSMSDSIVWSIKDFGYRPTLAVEHIIVDRDPRMIGAVALVAVKTIYANHYLAGRVQLAAVLKGESALGVPGHFIVLVDQIQFDDELNGFKRGLLGRGLRVDIEARMELLRVLADGTH